jgi:gliding motility-associated-like protein
MKNYLLLLSFFTFFTSQAQLSNKHWLPPLHSRDDSAIQDHYIYISTAETTPFQVNVTTGNGLPISGSPFTISQTNPVVVNVGNGQPTSMFLDINDVNIVQSDKGLILEGTKDFYVSFRMRHQNHAETLISKGRPGIGTNFRLGSTPQGGEISIRNFVSSVMATENNTTITLSDYNTNVEFVSGAGPITSDSQTFILNAGQSIVFSGYTDVFDNWSGFIGASLISSKPVAVSTGNATGGVTNNGSDFTLDQIVSSSQIGTEYIFIEGNGLPQMESPLIIADEDNTEVYVNGNTTASANLSAGDYYLVPNSEYQGTTNRNIYVKSSKPVFAYQLIGGDNSSPTSGLNFIPPLSCFFQESVYLPAIDQIGTNTYNADLMILTYSTATITVNGTPINTSQAQAVLGNTDWVTYRISGYSGNVNVVSTGPLAVGVFGASGAAGYAGYYSGFGSAPQDTPVAVCSSTTTNLFDAIIGNPGPGGTWTVPAGGVPLTGDFFNPNVNIPGEYIYSFTKTCNTALTFIDIKVNVTVEQANNEGTSTTKNTCKNDIQFDLFPLLGTGVTTGGIWSLNGVNRPNSNFNPATDISGDYKYTIPASGVCPELFAIVTVNNFEIPTLPTTPIADLKVCDDATDGSDTNGQTTFNLTSKTTEILNGQTNVSVTYHILQNDAIAGSSPILTYTGADKTIYVRLFNSLTNCYNTTSFNVVVTPLPVLNSSIPPLKQCDDDTDAISDFNLNEANASISTQTNLTFKYFLSQSDAQNNTSQITNETAYTSPNNGIVWVRIENDNECFRTAPITLIVSATQIPTTFQKIVLEQCDDFIDLSDPDDDGFDYFDLNEATNDPLNGILAQFTNSTNLIVTYYESQADALAESNPIDTTNPDGYRNTIANLQNIWVRIDSNVNNDCVGLGQYVDLKVNPLPDFELEESKVLCVTPGTGIGNFAINATPTTPGNYTYTWTPTNPETTAGVENAIFNASANGVYKVIVTNNDTSCFKEDQMEILISSAPQAVEVQLVSEIFASGLSTIQAVVIGGFGTYEYSLDQINWQTSPVFTNLENDIYIIYARDINYCGEKNSNPITTISYPNYFTPNGDGYNDTWSIRGLTAEFDAKIYIFDRYGKLLKQIDAYGNGWDGKFNGQEVPSTDYWFKIEYKEDGVQKEFKSHFSLKR